MPEMTPHGKPHDRPCLIVTTDISNHTPGIREPDDGQSMIRLLLYSNEIEIEGLLSRFKAPRVNVPATIPVLLEVTNWDDPRLTGYARVMMRIQP